MIFFTTFVQEQTVRKLTHEEIASQRSGKEEIKIKPRLPLFVVVDNVRSLYNVGSIFRSSDGALIQKLYLCGFTPYPPRKEIEKTALGATESVPWEYRESPVDVIKELKAQGIKICLLEQTNQSVPYYSIKLSDFPLCLVIGNELTGVSKQVIDLADMAIEIPMFGIKQSLNVAVAYGIAIYTFVHILTQNGQTPTASYPYESVK